MKMIDKEYAILNIRSLYGSMPLVPWRKNQWARENRQYLMAEEAIKDTIEVDAIPKQELLDFMLKTWNKMPGDDAMQVCIDKIRGWK